MGFSFDFDLSAFSVFLQGIISFFSPCILPLLPLYIGYLSGGTKSVGEDGSISYNRRKVMGNTLFFVIGISFAFFLLGLGMTAVGSFFRKYQLWFARGGGVLVIILGLYQLGMLGSSSLLEREYRLPIRPDKMAMSPGTAFLMGFTFSFAWTPCVGPALASVLIMTASAATRASGMALIGVYTIGFVLPFLAVGAFAAALLDLFKTYKKAVKYTVKLGGILMVGMGILMVSGKMNSLTGYLSGNASSGREESSAEGGAGSNGEESFAEESADPGREESLAEEESKSDPLPPAVQFTLTDQYGTSHTLSDYEGKTVFLNFWATWCPPCRAEMPDIQKIYEDYQEREDDSVVILGIAGPGQGQEQSVEGIKDFLEQNGYTYPVLMDESGEQFAAYGVYALPTTFMIDKEGNVFGYASGQLTEEMMRSIIRQTQEGRR